MADASRRKSPATGTRLCLARTVAVMILAPLAAITNVVAQEEPPAADRPGNVSFIELGEDIGPAVLGRLRNSALALGSGSTEDRRSVLVLEISGGDGSLDAALDIAEFLSSSQTADIRVVAWVPESLIGARAIIPLACEEIILHPDAELGDLAAAAPTEAQRLRIEKLAARRRNPMVPPIVVQAMLDLSVTLLRVTVGAGESSGVRVAAPAELEHLKTAGLPVQDVQVVKPAGRTAAISGAQAESLQIVAAHVARDRSDLADLLGFDPALLVDVRPAAPVERPILIKVHGEITPLLTSFLQRQIDRAVEQSADMIIFEIDSPGGLLQDSLDLASRIAGLRDLGVRTVAYIPRDAVSGGALIALGCDEIYLHPGGRIGDAGPIVQTLQGEIHRAPEKIVSYLREAVRELAELKGRPPAVLMAMVDRELDVFQATHRDSGRTSYLSQWEIDEAQGAWEQGPLVPESAGDLLLFVNGRRAHDLQVAEPPVKDLADLRERLGIRPGAPLVAARQTWLDDLVFVLNTGFVTGALFFLGIILLFIELHFVTGLAGIVSAMCFGVFFWSKFLGGTSGWLEVVLFLIGFACVAIELFVIPGFGVFGVAGGLLLLSSLVMAGATISDLDRGAALGQSLGTAKTLGLAILCVLGAGVVLSHYLPRIPFLNAMILTPPAPLPSGSSVGMQRPDPRGLTGQQGLAVTMLRPSGKIRVQGQLADAVSSSGFIAAGTPIEIIEVASNRLIVKPCETAAS